MHSPSSTSQTKPRAQPESSSQSAPPFGNIGHPVMSKDVENTVPRMIQVIATPLFRPIVATPTASSGPRGSVRIPVRALLYTP